MGMKWIRLRMKVRAKWGFCDSHCFGVWVGLLLGGVAFLVLSACVGALWATLSCVVSRRFLFTFLPIFLSLISTCLGLVLWLFLVYVSGSVSLYPYLSLECVDARRRVHSAWALMAGLEIKILHNIVCLGDPLPPTHGLSLLASRSSCGPMASGRCNGLWGFLWWLVEPLG